MASLELSHTPVPLHPGEDRSNELRRLAAELEPLAVRTATPSLAVIAHSCGSYHYTPEHRKLADFTSGVLVANLGHHPVRWWRRVQELLGISGAPSEGGFLRAMPLTAYNALTTLELEAARRLVANLQSAPGGTRMEQVVWAASGSEAIQKALWAAMGRRSGSDIILATRRGFHGKKGLAGAVTGDEHSPERDRRVKWLSFPIDACRDIAHRHQPVDLTPFANELETLWQEHGTRICSLITEPYLGGGGSFHPQPEYLQLLQKFCRDHDILFILDEVQSNFGRTGSMYAFTHYGLEPDLVVLGKGLGNGVPVAATVGPADVFASLKPGDLSDTWSGNPLSSAAVIATLDEFENTNVLEHAEELAQLIERHLIALQKELDCVVAVRGEGVVWGIELGAHNGRSPHEMAMDCVKACYLGDEQGRAIHLLGPLSGCVLRVSPPLVMPLDEADEYFHVLRERFAAAARGLEDEA
jgi:4-aminobutyrate aminotransferase-like enzyme